MAAAGDFIQGYLIFGGPSFFFREIGVCVSDRLSNLNLN